MLFNRKKEHKYISLYDVDFSCNTPLITGGYNIFAVYNAIILALSLYDQAEKKKKDTHYLKQYKPIWIDILNDLSKYIDNCKLKSDL